MHKLFPMMRGSARGQCCHLAATSFGTFELSAGGALAGTKCEVLYGGPHVVARRWLVA